MISQGLIQDFQKILGQEQVFVSEADRLTYAYDAAVLEPVLPGPGGAAPIHRGPGPGGAPVQRPRPAPDRARGRHQPERRHHPPPGRRGGPDQRPESDPGDQRSRPLRRGAAGGDHRQTGRGGGGQGAVLSAGPGLHGGLHPGRQRGGKRRGPPGPEIRGHPGLRHGPAIFRGRRRTWSRPAPAP